VNATAHHKADNEVYVKTYNEAYTKAHTEAYTKAYTKTKDYVAAKAYAFTETEALAETYAKAYAASKNKVKVKVNTLILLATDCLRLSMHFFHPIQQCAQQVYHTAVPLSPTSSQLCKFYLQTIIDNHLSHVTAFSGAPNTWGLLLRTIDVRPRELTCVAASVQKIIVACEDIVNIYDAVTFVLQQSLCAPEIVRKIQGSPDGSILFFAHSFTVTMWDVQTGGLIDTLNTPSKICDIAVSMTHIACGLSDGSVMLWDIHTREENEGFGNDQPVVTVYWLSLYELAVATQGALYIYNPGIGETMGRFSVPGHVWGMVYLKDKNEFLVGTSQPNPRVGQEDLYFFVRCQHPKLQSLELELIRRRFVNLGQSPTHSRQLLSPTLVGKEIACMTLENGVQSFNTSSYNWTKSSPLLGGATGVAVSLSRNLVVQTKDSIQIFSTGVLTNDEAHTHSSHVYPLGESYIVCVQPTRHLILLELETMKRLHPDDNTLPLRSLLTDQLASAHAPFGCGLVAEFGVSVVVEAWKSGSPLPEQMGTAEEDMPLCGWSPGSTKVVTVYNSPWQGICVKDAKDGTILANLPLEGDELGMGEVYDITFESETRFYLKIDGPGKHIQIPYDVITSASGHHSHMIIKGKPVPLLEPRAIPPYTLDANYEWVIDAKSRKICWISPGDVRRGSGGHFWSGPSLVMVGDDGVVRKLTFKDPDS